MKSGSFDLHCHSTQSDGEKTPFELIDLAKENNLLGIAITDHDTVSSYTKELFQYAKKQSIEIITGVEFSSYFTFAGKSIPIHILGYNIDINDGALKTFCKMHKERREKRFFQILEKLKYGGYEIDPSILDLDKKTTMGRPHIAKGLIEKGYVKSMEEAFKRFLGESSRFYVKSNLPDIKETIDMIKQANGKAVLAHPILIKSRRVLKEILKKYQFDGMECFYGNFPRSKIEYLLTICSQNKLSVTGGSDYHGNPKKYIYLGSSYTTKEYLERLLSI